MIFLQQKCKQGLKAIKKAGKRKPEWNFEKIKSKENDVEEVLEQKFGEIDELIGYVEDSWGTVK